jgi:outer membrane receptor protein involved in Fe transport
MNHPRAFARVTPRALFALTLAMPVVAGGQRPDSTRRDTTRRDTTRRDTTRRDTTRAAPASGRPVTLEAVTITTKRVERYAPAASVNIGAAALRQTPAVSAPDLLRLAAGVEVHEQGQGPGFASNASVRGFSSDHSSDLALWVDGVPVNEPVNGHAEGYNDWGLIFPRGIEDIDVIKGPTSALFGNFALSGVVNVRTLDRMSGTELSASGGAFGRASATLLTGFERTISDRPLDYAGVFGLHAQREDGFRPNSRNDVLQGHARLLRDLTHSTTIDGAVELYGANWDSPGYLSAEDFANGDIGVVTNPTDGGFKRRAQERVSLSRLVNRLLNWRSTVYATQGRWQLFLTVPPAGGRFEGLGSQIEEEDRRAGYGLTSALTWTRPRNEVTLGVEGRFDDSDFQRYFTTARRRDSTATDVSARQVSVAFFVQTYRDVTTRLRVDLGVRADALTTRSAPAAEAIRSATNAIVSPKVGAQVRLAGPVAVYANLSRGFRSADGIIDDPTLPLITTWAYEAGVKVDDRVARGGGACGWQCAAGARTRSSLAASVFRMNVSNEQTMNPATLQATSGGASRRQGVDVEGGWAPTRTLRMSAEWTFTDAKYVHFVNGGEDAGGPGGASATRHGSPVRAAVAAEGPQVLDGLRVFNTAKYVGVASIDLGPNRALWRGRLSGNWVGPYAPFDEPGVLLGGYGLAHASAIVPLGRLEWDVGVRNLLNRRYPELVAGGRVSPGIPRAAYVTVRALW